MIESTVKYVLIKFSCIIYIYTPIHINISDHVNTLSYVQNEVPCITLALEKRKNDGQTA